MGYRNSHRLKGGLVLLEKRLNELYEMFVGLPNSYPIVRNQQKNDAFVLLVAETLFNNSEMEHKVFSREDLPYLTSFIIPPPDNGIDIFFEEEDCDEVYFHIVQVKYTSLFEHEINSCFAVMRRTIEQYLRNPRSLNNNLKEVISRTKFTADFTNNCTYYVVHNGDIKGIRGQKKDERIITTVDLETLMMSLPNYSVPKETLRVDSVNNFILNRPYVGLEACLCSLNGYDLAVLNNRYASTEVGRNILFGQNLRDSLDKKSKTYKLMFNTVNEEPQMFWYYNNGISIICESMDMVAIGNDEAAALERFSIINGAQTTSTLGAYLKDAELNNEADKIEKLKQVHVLARIVQIKEEYKDQRNDIAIYNNTQNPISTRDMVSNREEQRQLYQWLLAEDPRIFVEIRRGARKPSNLRFLPHRVVTNEVLAQYAHSGFLLSPYTAKAKKKTLFNNDMSGDWNLNEEYHKIFNFEGEPNEKGILFRKTKKDIDELLFIAHLCRESNKAFRSFHKTTIDNLTSQLENSDDTADKQARLSTVKRLIEISNVCLFFNIALYYAFKREYEVDADSGKTFKFKSYYDNEDGFKHRIIDAFINLFHIKTIEIIKTESYNSSANNWIKIKNNETKFLNVLREQLALKAMEYQREYKKFVDDFKS